MSRSSTRSHSKPKRYYIGDKPEIDHINNEEPLSYRTEHEAKCAEGDYLAIDDQGFDQFKENE